MTQPTHICRWGYHRKLKCCTLTKIRQEHVSLTVVIHLHGDVLACFFANDLHEDALLDLSGETDSGILEIGGRQPLPLTERIPDQVILLQVDADLCKPDIHCRTGRR